MHRIVYILYKSTVETYSILDDIQSICRCNFELLFLLFLFCFILRLQFLLGLDFGNCQDMNIKGLILVRGLQVFYFLLDLLIMFFDFLVRPDLFPNSLVFPGCCSFQIAPKASNRFVVSLDHVLQVRRFDAQLEICCVMF